MAALESFFFAVRLVLAQSICVFLASYFVPSATSREATMSKKAVRLVNLLLGTVAFARWRP
jgi:hypothetical protein